MDSIKQTFRRLFRKGEHTATRIISLTAGLAFGILLFAEVLYYFSFDGFYPDANRIYIVHENFKADETSDKTTSYPRVSGAIAPGLKNEVPGIEAATRLNGIGTSVFYTEDKKSYSANFVLADEHLFEVLPRPVISGNPKEILKSPMHCMVSSTIADAIGKNTIGKVIELKEYPGQKLTISGVFKALPENTNLQLRHPHIHGIYPFFHMGRNTKLAGQRPLLCCGETGPWCNSEKPCPCRTCHAG